MGSEIIKLPFIDFSNLKQENSPTWDTLKTQVQQALQEYGCFEAKFDQIPLHLRKSTIDAIKQLFDLPSQTKLRNTSETPYHGYIGQYSHVPLYESMGIEDALSPGQIESFANLMWSQGNPTFCKSVQSFVEQLSELDWIVRRMVVENLGLEKYMDEHMNSTNYLVRVQKYEGPQSQESKLGLASHTDNDIVSVLYQDEVSGLEMQIKDGQWITAQSNSFVVIIGNYFHAWTNGRLHSPNHRVMISGDKARYSFALFSYPKSGYIIKAPPEMVDEEHPLLFKPFEHFEFLHFYRSQQLARKSQATLKDYCGV